MAKKLWDKNASLKNTDHAQLVERFTAGDDANFDMVLAEFDVLGSLAHIEMLCSIGLLKPSELEILKTTLNTILKDIKSGVFQIEAGIEDIHSQIEYILTERVGALGKKIHSGRSRNDQVLVDLKLYFKHEIQLIVNQAERLFHLLQQLSEQHKNVYMPGYTHLQIAMPSSFGLWFGAYAEALVDDLELLAGAYKVVDKNPLGSAAGYGSSFPLDRALTTNLLGFETMNFNVVYAQMTRGKTERILAMALANLAATLSKMAYDICLYMSQNMGFISFPDDLTTGSSIMPHKKNPDVFELIRAKCNLIQAVPNDLTLLTANLPSGYHRDAQLTKSVIFPAITSLKDCFEMTVFMLQHIQVNKDILNDKMYDFIFSVESVNREVMSGLSFRDAYKKVAEAIENNTYKPDKDLNHTHAGSMGNLCNDNIKDQLQKVLARFGRG